MWKLPNGSTTNFPRDIDIDGVQYPKNIFLRWTPEQLSKLGIFPFRENEIDDRHYRSMGHTDNQIGDTIVRTHTITPRYTLAKLKQIFGDMMRRMAKDVIVRMRDEVEFLQEFSPTDPELSEWATYRTDYKAAFQTIKSEAQAITDYQELVDYIDSGWQDRFPQLPNQVSI
jgi:hypothetical protein